MSNEYNNSQYIENEKEIDLIQMLLECLLHYRSLIVICIIGVVLGGVIGYTTRPHVQKAKISTEKSVEENAKAAHISTDSLRKMRVAADYYSEYVAEREYIDNSYYTSINPNRVYSSGIKYLIRAKKDFDLDERIVARKYMDAVDYSDESLCEMIKNLGIDTSSQYLGEIVGSSEEFFNVSGSDSEMDEPISKVSDVKSDSYDIVTFSVYFPNEDGAQLLLKEIKKRVEDIYESEQDKQYVMECINTYGYYQYASGYTDVKTKHVTSETTALNGFNNIYITFSDIEKTFFDAYFIKSIDKLYSDDADASDKETSVDLVIVSKKDVKKSIIIKTILGALIAFVIWLIVWVMMFILSKSLKNVDEIRNITGIPVLGLKNEGRGNKLDKVLYSLVAQRAGLRWSADYIVKAFGDEKISAITICNLTGNEQEQSVCSKENWNTISDVKLITEPIYVNSDSLDIAKKSGNEIIAVAINKTKREDLYSEIRTAKQHGIKVVGIVCV